MFVVTVIFELHPARCEEFEPAILAQARNSLDAETDCLQFDVCRNPQREEEFFLYEIYRDRAAFDAHLDSPHYKHFDATVTPMVANKTVNFYVKL
ncbi:MAG: antibiotic biosynthesis monooxygenase [Gammaproteobacteria bacterium]|nr:antibiotic biosynthesis monooxygenase [Gammaproteobacteria bacterium]